MPATIASVDALLIELTRRGIELLAHGDRLRFRPRSAMTPDPARDNLVLDALRHRHPLAPLDLVNVKVVATLVLLGAE